MKKESSATPKRVVVKLGTGVLTTGIGQLDTARIADLAAQLAALRAAGTEVIVVSSGAVGLGMGALALAKKPKDVSKKQACAAIGQSRLMQVWQTAFAPHALTVAQVLLTHDDLSVRTRYLGVRETLRQIIGYGAIPIINENDTVSAAEIKFGDNDTLSALVASLVEAEHLIILSTAPGLIDLKGTGEIVPVVEKITPAIEAMAGGTTSETATGGMISKITAAKLATRAGCGVFIASGSLGLMAMVLLWVLVPNPGPQAPELAGAPAQAPDVSNHRLHILHDDGVGSGIDRGTPPGRENTADRCRCSCRCASGGCRRCRCGAARSLQQPKHIQGVGIIDFDIFSHKRRERLRLL